MRRFFILALLLPLAIAAASQDNNLKYEKEERIKPVQVPEQARDFIQKLDLDTKIKWYKEYNLERTSIEAKTKYQGKKYSIEFSATGEIEDIQVLVQARALPSSAWENIQSYMSKEFEKYKLCKAQIQYQGSVEELQQIVQGENPLSNDQIKYELIFKTKKQKQKHLIEFLFDASGQFIAQQQIIFRNTDNLEY